MEDAQGFKAGDEVPQWVEKTFNCRCHFIQDARVVRRKRMVAVYPKSETVPACYGIAIDTDRVWIIAGLIRAEKIADGKFGLYGAPTQFFRHPQGDPQNDEPFDIDNDPEMQAFMARAPNKKTIAWK